MWAPLCHRLSLIMMVACIAATQAVLSSGGLSGMDVLGMEDDETTGSLGHPGGRNALALSEEQRSHIYESVMKMTDSPTAQVPPPDVAQRLPGGVPLQDLPAGVTRAVPLAEGHKFVKFDDRILLVDPATRVVVAMIPRYRLLQ